MCLVQYTNIKFYCHMGKWKQKFTETLESKSEISPRSLSRITCLTLSVQRPFKLSKLSVRTVYIYSAAFQATSPGGVYILRDFLMLVKKKVLGLLASGLYH